MPTKTIPLVGQPTQRGLMTAAAFTASQDQRCINCFFSSIVDKQKRSQTIYVQKRAGFETYSTPESGSSGHSLFVSPSTLVVFSVFHTGSTYNVYANTTNCGDLKAAPYGPVSECIFSGITYILYTTTSGTAWFLASDAVSGFTFTGDTATSTTITNVSSLTGLYVGQLLSGHADIAAGTRIASITSPSTITLTLATVGTHSGITITREGIAKIIDADFTSNARGIVEMDGYIFALDGTNSRVYNSDLNSLTSWTANNYISANIATDVGLAIAKVKNRIVVFGGTSIEFFYNAGNPTGSILSSDKSSVSFVGGGSSGGVYQINDYTVFSGPVMLNPGVWLLEGNVPKKISSVIVDRAISSTTGSFNAGLTGFFYAGYTWVLFAAAGGGSVFLYCIELDSWTQQSFPSSYSNGAYSPTLGTGPLFIDSGTVGSVYMWDKSPVYTDAGAAFTMTIQTEPYFLNDGEPFIIDEITLLADTQSSGSSTLTTSGDDYATFGTVGSFDLTQQQKNLSCGGYYDSHVIFKLTDAGNNAWRGQGLKIKWRPYA